MTNEELYQEYFVNKVPGTQIAKALGVSPRSTQGNGGLTMTKCLSCTSTTIRWYGYQAPNQKLYSCKRCKASLQRKCPGVIIFPVPKLRWMK